MRVYCKRLFEKIGSGEWEEKSINLKQFHQIGFCDTPFLSIAIGGRCRYTGHRKTRNRKDLECCVTRERWLGFSDGVGAT